MSTKTAPVTMGLKIFLMIVVFNKIKAEAACKCLHFLNAPTPIQGQTFCLDTDTENFVPKFHSGSLYLYSVHQSWVVSDEFGNDENFTIKVYDSAAHPANITGSWFMGNNLTLDLDVTVLCGVLEAAPGDASGMKGWQIAMIVVICILLIVISIVIALFLVKKRRSNKKKLGSSADLNSRELKPLRTQRATYDPQPGDTPLHRPIVDARPLGHDHD